MFASRLPLKVQQYLIVTFNYWAFTLTDGALRMLVVLYFHGLGYSALEVASLFLFYEFFGVVTNLVGGWIGARIGLNRTMNLGLCLQIIALSMLLVDSTYLTVFWVMMAQAISGIAKDLNKMSAKSSVKTLVDGRQASKLYRWIAFLTGSKNTLKGVGFFLGGFLLSVLGFQGAVLTMAVMLSVILVFSLLKLQGDIGKAKSKPKFSEMFSKSKAVNTLSAARLFLFASRDVWFVVGLPVFLSTELAWTHTQIGTFFATWIIGYGIVQALAPKFTHAKNSDVTSVVPVVVYASALLFIPLGIIIGFKFDWNATLLLVFGLLLFAVVFAINSALHSFLIVHYANDDGVSLDVGFYYMANAAGRLVGTVLSGWAYQSYGLLACLVISGVFIVLTILISFFLPKSSLKDKVTEI